MTCLDAMFQTLIEAFQFTMHTIITVRAGKNGDSMFMHRKRAENINVVNRIDQAR